MTFCLNLLKPNLSHFGLNPFQALNKPSLPLIINVRTKPLILQRVWDVICLPYVCVCVCVCMYVRVYLCLWIAVRVYMRVSLCVRPRVSMYVCVSVLCIMSFNVCTPVCASVCVHQYARVWMWVHENVRVCVLGRCEWVGPGVHIQSGYLQALPGQTASQEVHEHVTQSLQVISSALLWREQTKGRYKWTHMCMTPACVHTQTCEQTIEHCLQSQTSSLNLHLQLLIWQKPFIKSDF